MKETRKWRLLPKEPGFPGGSDGEASAYNAGDWGSIPGLGRSPGEGNGNPLEYSCWKIPWMEKPGRLQSMGSQSRIRLSDFTFTFPKEPALPTPCFSASQDSFWTPDLQKHKIINVYCFNPRSWWSFLTAATGN